MIVDVTGIELVPGNLGQDCPGNGPHRDNTGNLLECCCDECDYLLCCMEEHDPAACTDCEDRDCPKNQGV